MTPIFWLSSSPSVIVVRSIADFVRSRSPAAGEPFLVTLTPHPTPAVRCSVLLGGAASGYSTGMTKATEAVLADGLRLDAESRARLAAEILASLDGPADPDAEQAWQAEIARRVADLEASKLKLESCAEVKRRIEKSILGR